MPFPPGRIMRYACASTNPILERALSTSSRHSPLATSRPPAGAAPTCKKAQGSKRPSRRKHPPQKIEDPFPAGEVVGNAWRILRRIGAGGYGVVYEAQDDALGRLVALKVASKPDVELRTEAEATSAFRHPGVAMVYGAGRHRGHFYIAMERLHGQTLWEHIHTALALGKSIPVLETIDILSSIADTLGVVHAAGLVHRDVKPSNVMLVPDGRVVLMDFGLFLPRASVDRHPRGTAEFMAPETLSGSPACPSADIYSLGITAYETLTGDLPFHYRDVRAMLRARQPRKAEPLRHGRPEVPSAIADLIHEMIDTDPLARPDAGAVSYRLSRIKQAVQRRIAGGFQVMVVDDDRAVSALLSTWLGKRVPDAEVRVLHSGDSALAAIRASAPDVLLLDLNMPKTSGIELCMELRGMHIARDCVIVSVSAAADEYDELLLRSLGVSRFVTKDASMLREVERHVLAQRELFLALRRTD